VIAVVEADEYDRSFLSLSPNVAIVTAVDPDHLDIYDDTADFENTFKEFAALIDDTGVLIQNEGIDIDILPVGDERPVVKYGFGEVKAQAYNVRAVDGEQVFDLYYQDVVLTDVVLTVPGLHNIQNVLAAATAAFCMGMDPERVKGAIATYRGVKRRFEYIQKESNFVYVDDYAHHPSELQAFISSARALFPEKRLEVVFQPHLFTRTRDFIDGFASVLSQVDKLWLLDIYPARELPIKGVTSDWLLNKIEGPEKGVISKERLLEAVTKSDNTVFATLGAGDIGGLVEPLKKRFEKVG
jgi:UDP-N-acetylmuramate--alanine ligase